MVKYRIRKLSYGSVVKYYIERKNAYKPIWYPITMILGNLEFQEDDVYIYLLFDSIKEAKEFITNVEIVNIETVEEFTI